MIHHYGVRGIRYGLDSATTSYGFSFSCVGLDVLHEKYVYSSYLVGKMFLQYP